MLAMTSVQCIPMDINHIDSVYAISCSSFHVPWSQASIMSELVNPAAKYVVAVCDGKVIGFGGMWIILDEAHITNIAVAAEHRKTGVGSLILEALIATAEKADALAMTLEVRASNSAAQKLYEKHYFAKAGLRKGYYQDNNEDCIIMWRR